MDPSDSSLGRKNPEKSSVPLYRARLPMREMSFNTAFESRSYFAAGTLERLDTTTHRPKELSRRSTSARGPGGCQRGEDGKARPGTGRGTMRMRQSKWSAITSAAIMKILGSWWEVVAPVCAPNDPNRPALVVPKGQEGLSVRRRWERTCLVDKMGRRLWRPFHYGGLLVKLADGASLRGRRVC